LNGGELLLSVDGIAGSAHVLRTGYAECEGSLFLDAVYLKANMIILSHMIAPVNSNDRLCLFCVFVGLIVS